MGADAVVPSHVAMVVVRSTSIRAIGYDVGEGTLYLRFANGAVYRVASVPVGIFHDFLASTSKGKFYDERIRDAYPDVTCLRGRSR